MVVNYLTTFNANNINIWSGLGVYYKQLLAAADIQVNDVCLASIPNRYTHALNRRMYKLIGKNYSSRFNRKVAKYYAQQAVNKIEPGSVIFTPNIEGLAFLPKQYKKILYSDATFERLLNFYPSYSRFSKKTIDTGHQIEKLALENADLIVYTSKWAADSAINYYKIDSKKIHVIPFASNLAGLPGKMEVESFIEERDLNKKVELIFFGTDWERKGVDMAIQVVNGLNEKGIESVLHVAGIKKFPKGSDTRFIVDHGFFSKEDAANQKLITQLLLKSHFLILPTKADCTPIVFSEANSCGLPCITTNIGGNSSIIKDNVNGKAFALEDFVKSTIDYIITMKQSRNLYNELCRNSYSQFLKELNMETASSRLSALIAAL